MRAVRPMVRQTSDSLPHLQGSMHDVSVGVVLLRSGCITVGPIMSNRNYFTESEIDTLTNCACPGPYEAGEPYACACGITWTWHRDNGCWMASSVAS